MCASRRPCQTRWSARPTRSSSWTCRRMRCGGGWPTATSTRRRRSTPRWPTTSAKATSPRSGSCPSCGSPTASRRVSTATAPTTRSPSPWPTRERVVVALTGGQRRTLLRRAAQIASAVRGRAARGLRHATRRPRGRQSSRVSGSCASSLRSSAAPSTPSRGKTPPRRCSTSPGASTPARSSSAPRGGPAGGHFSRRAWASASWTARAISTSTS